LGKSGVKIRNIYTNIPAPNVIVKHSRAIIPLAERGNKVVTPSDVMRVNHQAKVLGANLEEEIIHRIPYSYSVDSKEGV
jgi:cell division ATPase FtsA